jgi:DNA-binding transcriptional ArsR family regulator
MKSMGHPRVSLTHATFRALADETRRDILGMLRDGPRTSGEIASAFTSSWPTISRHLAVLRAGGLVLAERKGPEIFYELNTSVFQDLARQALQWIGTGRSGGHTARRPAPRRLPIRQEV